MMGLYILEGHTPVPVPDDDATLVWAKRFEKMDRRVAKDQIGAVRVSTVFLGLDHAYGDGPPQLFETMIFGGEHDKYQERCSTWEEAEAMHAKAVALVRAEGNSNSAR